MENLCNGRKRYRQRIKLVANWRDGQIPLRGNKRRRGTADLRDSRCNHAETNQGSACKCRSSQRNNSKICSLKHHGTYGISADTAMRTPNKWRSIRHGRKRHSNHQGVPAGSWRNGQKYRCVITGDGWKKCDIWRAAVLTVISE